MKRDPSLAVRLALPIIVFTLIACTDMGRERPPAADAAYVEVIESWHRQRMEGLSADEGWLTLVGLHWLEEGRNTFGSAKDNDLVFPEGKMPERAGALLKNGGACTLEVEPGVEITVEGETVTSLPLQSDRNGAPTMVRMGSLSFFLIARGDRLGVRVKDSDSPLRTSFKGIERFPVDPRWRVEAKLIPFDPPRPLALPNVLGDVDDAPSPGILEFGLDGRTLSLTPVEYPDAPSLFIVFADETSAVDTYGGGRFLAAPLPDEKGMTILDFNKAYNPPCAFTPYATCPLPPKENRLSIRIEAGEKTFGKRH